MSRKKKHEHVNHERWLVSYADFITLLFAFFVVLFASGQSDKRKQVQLAASIQAAFAEMGVMDGPSKAPPLTITPGQGGADPNQSAAPPVLQAPAMAPLKQRLSEAAASEIGNGLVAIHESGGGLVLSLREAGFFDSGSAAVRPSAIPVIERIASALPESALRVEGHTDDVPISTPQFASNWELSSARASSIARLLLHHPNVRPENVSVAGYAEFHPVASNASEQGRAQNRRVDIVILNLSR